MVTYFMTDFMKLLSHIVGYGGQDLTVWQLVISTFNNYYVDILKDSLINLKYEL